MLEQDEYFAAVELGLESLNPQIDCNISAAYGEDGEELDGYVTAVLTVTEDIRFHLDLDRKYPMDTEVFTKDGVLTEAACAALERLVTERYKGEAFEYEDGDGNPENAFFRFEIALVVPADIGEAGDLGGKLWEETELVKFHNEADPGTFGSQYLFGTLIADAMKA